MRLIVTLVWIIAVPCYVNAAADPKIAVDLINGTINGKHIKHLNLDALTDLLGPPAYMTDIGNKETNDPQKVNRLHFPRVGMTITGRGVDSGKFNTIIFSIVDKDPKELQLKHIQATGPALGLTVLPLEVKRPDDVELLPRLKKSALVLRGAKPAEVPVEQPTRFELLINLNTAKQLGLTIPPSILYQA